MGSSPDSAAPRGIDRLYAEVRAQVGDAPPGPPPALVPVAPGIRAVALRTPTLPPATHTNAYVIGPARGPQIVVDPGSPYPEEDAALAALLEAEAGAGRPVGLVALTHHHGDHVGGAAALAARLGVAIAAHEATAERLAGQVDVTRRLADGERLDGLWAGAGGLAVECVWTPGHAPGHLCFATADATVAGDMVAGVGTILIDPSEGDMAEYLASLRRLLARPAAALLPAHGAPIADGPGKLREYLAHRELREGRVAAALAATPRGLDELVALAYADTPRALWGLASRSLLAHLVKLVRDGRAREVESGRWIAERE